MKFPLEEAPRAVEEVTSRRSTGKVVLLTGPSAHVDEPDAAAQTQRFTG